MRLFVSYARVDKPICLQIVNTLSVHEVWYDQRLYVGQRWWPEILRRLDWCEGFVYLLSPDSIASKACRDEYKLAKSLGKPVFPVLIHDPTPLPPELANVQYADLSKGLTSDAVRVLLGSIYLAEKEGTSKNGKTVADLPVSQTKAPEINLSTVVGEAVHAMDKGLYDQAVLLLEQAIAQNYQPRFINLHDLLEQAKEGLEKKTRAREMERDYKQIAVLVLHQPTRKIGCQSLAKFRKDYPNYDPQNLANVCGGGEPAVAPAKPAPRAKPDSTFPLLEWCLVPAGMVTVEMPDKNGQIYHNTFFVDAFEISKYPVTAAQFQVFLDDREGGYSNAQWWDFSTDARDWRGKNPQPKPPHFKGPKELPRENVTWYESVAFTRWFSAKLGQTVTLPSEQQWQRAAQGDDGRLYPWGNTFDPRRCNTRESRIRKTTVVTNYPKGVSPYGVFDMAGNVWEWCLNMDLDTDDRIDITINGNRAVHGGSFIGVCERAQAPFHFYLNPFYFYATIGFRLIRAIT